VLGGVTLLIALLLLLKPSSISRDAALVKAFLGNLLSGIVGGIAWEMRSQVILGRDRASHIETSGSFRQTHIDEYRVYRD
jgi:hypothetical protein